MPSYSSALTSRSLLSLAISSVGITLAAAPATAQLVLEEVIVTAQKRTESLQDVPISVAAMSGEKMEDNGDTYSIYLNCADEPNSLTVQVGWTRIVRMYLPNNELETIDYFGSIRSIKQEEM